MLFLKNDLPCPERMSVAVVVDGVGLDVTKRLEQTEDVVFSDRLAEVG